MRHVRLPERDEVARAGERLASHVAASPLVRAESLAGEVWLKLESQLPTGSFKVRGALAALTLDPAPVVAASAGNHALGVAWAAARLGIAATVVCPETASPAKLAGLRRLPAELILHGRTYDEAEAYALSLAGEGRRYLSAYNDPQVVAGAGTIAVELLERLPAPLTVLCPVGGGGLISGVALWASAVAGVRVVGVESEASPTMHASLAAGRIVTVDERPTLADGLAGSLEEGSLTFELVRRHVDEVAVVREDEIAAAMRYLAAEHRLVVEGAGATALAALLSGRVATTGRTAVLVTGRNVALDVLSRVLAGA